MPTNALAILSPAVAVTVAAAAAALTVLGWLIGRARGSPGERERKRRLMVYRHGRISAANIVDYRSDTLHYTYVVAGAEYTASQDVSSLRDFLPPDPAAVIGPGSVKYLPRNPANSIVVCEQWSGLRLRPRGSGTGS